MNNKNIFLETACKIGERICKNAIWQGNECTWEIVTFDKENLGTKKAIREIADGNLYQGTSGIAIFLAELFAIAENKIFGKTAEGAANYSLHKSEDYSPTNFGFHSGKVGIAYSLYKIGKIKENDSFIDSALKILLSLKGNEHNDYGIDVIGGGAGAIPPLLKIDEIFQHEGILELASNLGENLINKANKEPTGFSWGDSSSSSIRNLCGYAHGAAGMAHAFFELFNYTGNSKYLYAAEQAVEYENQFYNNKEKNWPDFRDSRLGEYIYQKRLDELKIVIKENRLEKYNTKYMSAWCHGAPGIGLSRLRAYEITKEGKYKDDSLNAIEGTLSSFQTNASHNFSLCHGFGGNCETLVYGAEVLGKPDLLKEAELIALDGVRNFEDKHIPWPCGTMGAASDPSLMLGEAGIGYFMLRLYSKDIPSVLAMKTNKVINQNMEDHGGYENLKEKHASYYWSKSIRAAKILGHEIDNSSIDTILKTLKNVFISKKENHHNYLEEIFNVEYLKYMRTISLVDFTEEFIFNLSKEGFNFIDWERSTIQLSAFTHVLELKYKQDYSQQYEVKISPGKNENYVVLFRKNNKYHIKELNLFSYLILNSIKIPVTLEELCNKVKTFLEPESFDMNTLKEKIIQQLSYAYEANFVTLKEMRSTSDIILPKEVSAESNRLDSKTDYRILKSYFIEIIYNAEEKILKTDPPIRATLIESYIQKITYALKSLYLWQYFHEYIENYHSKVSNREEIFFELLSEIKNLFNPEVNNYIIKE